MSLLMRLYRKKYTEPEEWIDLEKEGEKYTIRAEYPTLFREEIGYWKDAHSIHAWFTRLPGCKVDGLEHSVTRDQLHLLYDTVCKVIKSVELTPGKVFMGRTYDGGRTVDNTRSGMVIKDTTKAEALLPKPWTPDYTAYGYDYRYFEELVATQRILEIVLTSNLDVEFTFFATW